MKIIRTKAANYVRLQVCNKTQIDAQLKYPPLYLTITEKRQTSFIQYVTSKQSMSEDEESSQLIQNSGNDFRNLVAGMCYFIRLLNDWK